MVFEMLEFYRSIRSLNRIVQTTKYMQLIFVMMKESFICQSNKQTLGSSSNQRSYTFSWAFGFAGGRLSNLRKSRSTASLELLDAASPAFITKSLLLLPHLGLSGWLLGTRLMAKYMISIHWHFTSKLGASNTRVWPAIRCQHHCGKNFRSQLCIRGQKGHLEWWSSTCCCPQYPQRWFLQWGQYVACVIRMIAIECVICCCLLSSSNQTWCSWYSPLWCFPRRECRWRGRSASCALELRSFWPASLPPANSVHHRPVLFQKTQRCSVKVRGVGQSCKKWDQHLYHGEPWFAIFWAG